MQEELLNTINELGKHAFDAAQALGEINGKLVEQALETQLGIASLCVESGIKQASLAQGAKNPNDFWTGQSKLLEEYSGKLANLANEQMELLKTANEEYQAWFEKGLKQADNAAKTASLTVAA